MILDELTLYYLTINDGAMEFSITTSGLYVKLCISDKRHSASAIKLNVIMARVVIVSVVLRAAMHAVQCMALKTI